MRVRGSLIAMVVLLVLAGCATGPRSSGSSHCANSPGSYPCQLEQYMRL